MVILQNMIGNCYEVSETSGSVGLVCTDHIKSTRPHFCLLSPVFLSKKSNDELICFQHGFFLGRRNRIRDENLVLPRRPGLKRLWQEYPWNVVSHYDVGLFQIQIPAKKWKAISVNFPLVGRLACDEELVKNTCAGIYIDTEEFLREFLLSFNDRLEEFSVEQLPVQMFLAASRPLF